jgi:hypothetical protein
MKRTPMSRGILSTLCGLVELRRFSRCAAEDTIRSNSALAVRHRRAKICHKDTVLMLIADQNRKGAARRELEPVIR